VIGSLGYLRSVVHMSMRALAAPRHNEPRGGGCTGPNGSLVLTAGQEARRDADIREGSTP